MTERPRVSPLVIAALADAVPPRLRRRLDEQPDLAEGWQWSVSDEVTDVVASAEAIVTLRAPGGLVASAEQATCTCLLAPRCLHIAAVLLRLQLDQTLPQPLGEALERGEGSVAATEPVQLDKAQRAAAEQAWQAATALLESGAQGAGLVLVGELLRAVHSCRLASLPRLASAGLRVAQDLRALQAQRPEFRLELLTADFHELLRTASVLREAESAAPEWIGAARRAYTQIGSLRVTGLFSEAIVSGAGYAGVVTYVCDQHGSLWSIADVAPGGAERCQLAYTSPVDLGDASFDHRSLGRAGLHLQHATAAANHRLGAGRGVGAVRADGGAWTDEPLVGLWSASLEAQLDRAWAARDRPFDERRAGDDLLFLQGVVVGARDDALELRVGNVALAGFAPGAYAELAYRHNLRLFAANPGLPLLIVARVAFDRPRTVLLLAVAPGINATPEVLSMSMSMSMSMLELPPAWAGRVNLGLDQLQGANVRSAGASVVAPARTAPRADADPLGPLRQRLQQVLLGGRSAISQTTWSGVARDQSTLLRNQMPTAAQLLRAVKAAPLHANGLPRRDRLACAWLASRNYLSAASARLQRLGWLASNP